MATYTKHNYIRSEDFIRKVRGLIGPDPILTEAGIRAICCVLSDVVPEELYEQVKWERDTAIDTLRGHRLEMGEKTGVALVVRCKDCIYYGSYGSCEKRVDAFNVFYPNDFCSFGEKKNRRNVETGEQSHDDSGI